MSFSRAFMVAAALVACASPALAQGMQWAHTWDEALAEAQARNVPIMFTVHGDG